MRAFTDADYSRLADLENAARLADLEIERTPLRDIAKLDIANMTAGEIVTLANVMESIRVLSDALKRESEAYAGYSPSTSERRTGYNYPVQAEAGPPAYASTYEFSDEQKAAARQYLADKFREYVSDDPQVNTVDGPIRVSEVPRDANGRIDESWLDEKCTCDDHEKKRIDADKKKANGIGDPEIASGLYL